MSALRMSLIGCVLCCAPACNVNVPQLPGQGLFNDLFNLGEQIDNHIDDALTDPLNTKPYPTLIGGDADQLFYATNLGDIRLNFRGPHNDLVIPGIVGPSNVFEYDIARGKKELIHPLLPEPTTLMATDGAFVIAARLNDPQALLQGGELSMSLVVNDLYFPGQERILFDSSGESGNEMIVELAADLGRVAFTIDRYTITADGDVNGSTELRVVDMTTEQVVYSTESPVISAVSLHGQQLAFVEMDDSERSEVVLHDLGREVTTAVDQDLAVEPFEVGTALAANTLVWSVPGSPDESTVMAYDVPTGISRVWAEGVAGELRGATDDQFVTQEEVLGDNHTTWRLVVRKYDADGRAVKLADFREDGLAGQTRVIGGRAAWVNPERKVVLAPLGRGDRVSFQPN